MSPAWALARPPLPPPAVWWERRGGGGVRVLASGGTSDSAAASLLGVGVAGFSRSQESLVLAAPSSVASSVSAEGGHRSRSHEIRESTEDCSHSLSSWSSPSQGRDSREERRCARSWCGGLRDQSRELRYRSMDRSWSRGRRRSRRDLSRSPFARVRSRLSWSWSSDCYLSRRVCSRFRSDRLRSRRVRSRSPGRRKARRDRSRSHGSCCWSRGRSPLSSDCSRSRERSWRPGWNCRDRAEAVVASRDCGNSGPRVEPSPAVAGPCQTVLSLSGSLAQWDADVGSLFSAVGITRAVVLPGPAAPPFAC